ncbi:MAG: cytochrome c3 family protein [Myxococcales bacterium]|nr:cytochrome c3 family protein [Myxococcales bacterium]
MKPFIQKLTPFLLLSSLLLLAAVVVAFAAETKPQATPDPAGFAPETVTIEGIKKLFGPVMFTHKAHLGYAGKCEECHHHATPGDYPACGQCHKKDEIKTKNDNQIGLKGAYHTQCMGCHKASGSGPLGCTDCHEKLKEPVAQPKPAAPAK